VPAPACPLPWHAHQIHITLLHFNTPAHSRSSRYNQLQTTTLLSLSLPLNLFSSSIPRPHRPPPIRSPPPTSTHKPHQHHHVSAHINHPARAVLCASDSLIQDWKANNRRTTEPTLERLSVCLSARTAFNTTSSTYRHANLIAEDLKSSRLPRQPRALR
jgi:hypothetical protein